jgi:carbon starvation protein
MVFVMFMTLWAMFQQVIFQWSWFGNDSNLLLFIFGAVIFVFAIWIMLTAFSALSGKYDDKIIIEDE